jgi:signal recognition particle GTPase
MNELTKVKCDAKVVIEAPHEVLLVLDGSTGQNAFEQARQFTAATEVTTRGNKIRWYCQRRCCYWNFRSV